MELLRRYSNRPDLTKSIQDVLRRIDEQDKTDEPGVRITGGPTIGTRRLGQAEREAIVEAFRQGAKIRVLAERYGVSESCVKTTLWRNGVGRWDRY